LALAFFRDLLLVGLLDELELEFKLEALIFVKLTALLLLDSTTLLPLLIVTFPFDGLVEHFG